MKNLLFILLSSGLVCLSCNEEAKKFNVSKRASFNFPISSNDLDTMHAYKHLDFQIEGGLEDYKKYAEKYSFNSVSYEYRKYPDHLGSTGKVFGYLSSSPEVMLFEISPFDFTINSADAIMLIEGAEEALNNTVNENGSAIDIHMIWELDQVPAHFDFDLIFDTTVEANLDN